MRLKHKDEIINFTIKRLSTLVPVCSVSFKQNSENDTSKQANSNPNSATRYCLGLDKRENLQAFVKYVEYLQKLNSGL